MNYRTLIGAVLIVLAASASSAQYTSQSTYGSQPQNKAELVLLGGYAWTLGHEVSYDYYSYPYGELDVDDNAYWGAALDFNVSRGGGKTGQLRLLYRREDSTVKFTPYTMNASNAPFSNDATIEYWHIGGLGGMVRGKAMPFTAITLGGTRLVANGEDEWKFSMIFGLGVKVYNSEKIGFMIQGNWPITFTDSWGGVAFGTGGAGVAVGGTGISQLDIGGGLIIMF